MEAALALRPAAFERPPWARPALVAAALVALVSLVLPDLTPARRPLETTVRLPASPVTLGGVRVEARTTAAGVSLRWSGIVDADFDRWVVHRLRGYESAELFVDRSPHPRRHVDPDGVPGRDSYLLVALDRRGAVIASSHVVAPDP